MTRDDIIRMAREANLPACHSTHPKALERFAAIVAAAEREACAKVCKDIGARLNGGRLSHEFNGAAMAILARGQQ